MDTLILIILLFILAPFMVINDISKFILKYGFKFLNWLLPDYIEKNNKKHNLTTTVTVDAVELQKLLKDFEERRNNSR